MKIPVLAAFIYILVLFATFVGVYLMFISTYGNGVIPTYLLISLSVLFLCISLLILNKVRGDGKKSKNSYTKMPNAKRAWVTQRDEWDERRSRYSSGILF